MSEQLSLREISAVGLIPVRESETTSAESVPPRVECPQGAVARGGSAESGVWDYHGTGLLLPRGTVVVTRPDDSADLVDLQERLDAESARRGVRLGDQRSRHVKRSAESAAILDSLCVFTQSFGVDIFGAVTFSDEYASSNRIYSLDAALRDVHAGFRSMPMNHGRSVGYRGRFALAGEWHRTDREVPHVHFLLCSNGMPVKAVCEEVWEYFFRSRGRTSCAPIIEAVKGTRYALKDVLKQSIEHPEALQLYTNRPKRVTH